jgi:hypothetical protein
MSYEDRGHADSDRAACTPARTQLARVNAELSRLQAKDLPGLQQELATFVGKQDTLVGAYRTQFPALRKLWCDRQLDVERLYAHIRCEFPLDKPAWQKVVADCICTPEHDLHCLKRRVGRRTRCSTGPHEREFLAADARYSAAKVDLDALTGLVGQLTAKLAASLDLVGAIEKLGPTGRAVAIYLFYWKLLPAHKRLAPKDVSADCLRLGSEGDPHVLCKGVWDRVCKDEEGACKPPDEAHHEPEHHERPVPWLLPPDDYGTALDCAWDRYQRAREERAEAKAKYDADQDSLQALTDRLAATESGIDAAIENCLSAIPIGDGCCDQTN